MGVDWLDGGDGYDFAVIDRSSETRTINYDSITAASTTGQTLVDGTHIASIERINLTTGSGDDVVAIGGGSQSISTGAGDDVLRVTDLLGGNYWDAGAGDGDRLVADLSGMSSAIMLSSHSAG